MSDKKKVLVCFILDKSGSMATKRADVIGGFNDYIRELRKQGDVDYLFSLTLFDTQYENRNVGSPLAEIQELNENSYIPGGNTALYDAIGTTIRAVEGQQNGCEKVLVVVMTDGEENSSREWQLGGVKNLIQEHEARGNWTFVFLGATPDAWLTGMSLGVAPANALRYDPQHTGAVMRCAAAATMAYSKSAESYSADLFKHHHTSGIHRNPQTVRPQTMPPKPKAKKPQPSNYKTGFHRGV